MHFHSKAREAHAVLRHGRTVPQHIDHVRALGQRPMKLAKQFASQIAVEHCCHGRLSVQHVVPGQQHRPRRRALVAGTPQRLFQLLHPRHEIARRTDADKRSLCTRVVHSRDVARLREGAVQLHRR